MGQTLSSLHLRHHQPAACLNQASPSSQNSSVTDLQIPFSKSSRQREFPQSCIVEPRQVRWLGT